MDYQDNLLEKQVRKDINKLKENFVIDLIAAERLKEIFIYLYLSKGSRNQRGINLQTEKLKSVLHNCPRIVSPAFSAPSSNSACRV